MKSVEGPRNKNERVPDEEALGDILLKLLKKKGEGGVTKDAGETSVEVVG